jgi:type I restriction enzyme, S subunit
LNVLTRAATLQGWRTVRFDQILKRVERKVTLDDVATYDCAGVRWYGLGAFNRETLLGMQIKRKQQWILRAGDIVYNKLFAWKGAFAIADETVDGCIVSDKFPTYLADPALVDARFLAYYFRTPRLAQQAMNLSKGAAAISKLTLNPPQFWDLTIPLPPLDEQRRVMAHIEELATRIEEAKRLRREMMNLGDDLCRSVLFHDASMLRPTPMSELVMLRSTDVQVEQDVVYNFAGVYSFGKGVFKGPSKYGHEFAYSRLTRLKAGNFVYPKLMAWEGALGIVPEDYSGFVVSPEFPVFQVREGCVLPEVLDVYFRTPSVWTSLSGTSTGTNVRRRRLHPADFLRLIFPLPPMSMQLMLRDVRLRLVKVRFLQAQTLEELDALLPAVLDKAFRGEL